MSASFTDGSCVSTLKRTVFVSGRHWPTVTMSPSRTFSKQGERCTDLGEVDR